MNQKISALEKIILFSIFFPYIGLMPGADVQPTFILFSGVLFLLLINKVSSTSLFLLLVMVISGFLVLFMDINIPPSKLILVYIVSLLTPFFIYNFVINNKIVINLNLLYFALFIYLFVGVVQLFYPEFLTFLVTRDNTDQLIASGRGSKSLTGEPSQFGRVLILINVLFLFQKIVINKHVSLKKYLYFSVALLILNVILSRSFYAFAIHFFIVFLFSYYVSKKYLVVFSCISVISLLLLYIYMDPSSRFYIILDALATNPDFIFSQGAIRRVLNVPISIYASYQYGAFGAGFSGSNLLVSSLPFFSYDIPFTILGRNLGGVIEFYLRIGILSLPLFFVYFLLLLKCCSIKSFYKDKKNSIGYFFALSVFILTFLDGSPSDPMKWYILIYICLYRPNNIIKMELRKI